MQMAIILYIIIYYCGISATFITPVNFFTDLHAHIQPITHCNGDNYKMLDPSRIYETSYRVTTKISTNLSLTVRKVEVEGC